MIVSLSAWLLWLLFSFAPSFYFRQLFFNGLETTALATDLRVQYRQNASSNHLVQLLLLFHQLFLFFRDPVHS